MEEMKNSYNISVGKPEVIHHSEDVEIDEKIILEWILQK
jgi:hypothetical protein